MKLNKNNFYILSTPSLLGRVWVGILLLISQFSIAQKKEENIGTEVVNVVKPYTPTISDAFKVKETPELNDEGNTKKETIKYNIFSFPVASTFTPSKGKAEGVEKEEQAHLYNNYATFGAGNYGTFNAELFVNQDLNATDYVGGMFRHISSQGGIKDIELTDKYFDTSIDLTYGVRELDKSWNIDLGYQNQIYNWYGLPMNFGNALAPIDRVNLIEGIKPQQSYNNIYLGGKIDFKENILDDANAKFNHFSDAYGSSENRFFVKPTLKFNVSDYAINTDIIVDYLSGSFKNNYLKTNTQSLKYGFTNFGISPSFKVQEEDWTINIGVGVFYSMDNENSSNTFLIYPKINASYNVVGNLMIFYAGAVGDLKQNTYSDFVDVNPFLSPTLDIKPTDQQYDFFAGLKGKLTNTMSYNIRGSYLSEKNKALFKSNNYTANSMNENYAFGNSFQVVYYDMKTISFYGELKADITEDVSFGVDGTFSSYNNDLQKEAWNLPAIKLNAKIDFNITNQWYAGANVFFVGDRKDMQENGDIIYIVPPIIEPITLKNYFDVNAHVGFKYSERLTAFLRLNNITNKGYEKWLNYPVQGFQGVLGVNYKFDF